jgi:hypothetical protein
MLTLTLTIYSKGTQTNAKGNKSHHSGKEDLRLTHRKQIPEQQEYLRLKTTFPGSRGIARDMQAPWNSFVKINWNVTVGKNQKKMGTGVIIRDSMGEVLATL